MDAPLADPAPVDAPVRSPRGAACTTEQPCADDLRCLPLPGGYCASPCGVTGAPCDGACVETPRGELCMATCKSDADCRTEEAYVCEPRWRACLIPNTTAIVPRACPAPIGIARDPAFAPASLLSTAAAPGVYQLAPAATVLANGELVTLLATGGGNPQDVLGLARLDLANRRTLATPLTSPHARHAEPTLAR
ncbi:MAG: hypothetical protein H0X17_15700, partial [Deltaproteobacteria bacterium]|nr:hypothetical protein [Deltaproteobacteria bacterium]